MGNIEQVESACDTLWSMDAIIEWLFKKGRLIEDQTEFVHQLAHQIVAAGGSIDRLVITFFTINPLVVATSAVWNSDTDTTVPVRAEHGVRDSERYIGSPMQTLFETERSVRQSLLDLPASSHRAFTELAEAGFVDYYAMPISFTRGVSNAFIVSTKSPGGFSECDVKNLKRLRDYFAPLLEVFSLRQTARSVLDTYVGKRTSEKILSGMIKRGDADVINAALWFSDLRDFTHVTESLPADQVLDMLNQYFEFVAAAVSARGGEILRFIGDAMLIVFPIDENTSKQKACIAALEAARDAQRTLAPINHQRQRHKQPEIRFGVGLNVGEVIYGNVGAPDRLDFTVMGPAVNRTARMESLTKTIGEDILFSAEFAQQVGCGVRDFGEHPMKGVAEPVAVFAPEESCG